MSVPTHRILFVTPPGYGHAFPIIRLATALRELGNDVLVATCGVSLNVAAGAGLPTIDVTPGVNLVEIYEQHRHSFGRPAEPRRSDQELPSIGLEREEELFVRLGRLMLNGVLQAAQEFRARVIVHTPYAAAAAVASAMLSIPRFFLGIGLAHHPELLNDPVYLRVVANQSKWSELPGLVAWIDVSPPSIRPTPSNGWNMTYYPYAGKGRLAAELAARPKLPRIAVTLGTIVPFVQGLSALRWVASVAPKINAEFVIAHGAAIPTGLGQLPHNVKAITWCRFDKLFDTCVGVIHHGGSGTTLTALRAGLPQILIPQGADQFYNAAAVSRRGAAALRDDALEEAGNAADCALVKRLLTDSSLARSAMEVREEMLLMPTESDVARRLVECIP